MVDTVTTNPGSLTSIRSLNKSSNLLNKTQNRISTGLKVSGPRDNAAIFAINQLLQGQVAGAGAVQGALRFGESAVNVATTAGTEVSNLLTDLKGIAVQASQEGLDDASRQALQNEFNSLVDQVNTVTNSANFNGINLVESGASGVEVLSGEDGSTISVSAEDLSSSGLSLDGLMLDSAANSLNALNAVDAAISQTSQSLANLGSSANSIETQAEFTTQLRDTLREGVGNLVDANLGVESAGLAANSIKQQLGLTAQSIANAGPASILALFK
tara:strand:- start:181 stop:996 length:816 start_codon:yes stop_codon:yes gene_type:complete